MVKCSPSTYEAQAQLPAPQRVGVVTTWNPRTQEVEAVGPRIRGQFLLQNEFKAILGYVLSVSEYSPVLILSFIGYTFTVLLFLLIYISESFPKTLAVLKFIILTRLVLSPDLLQPLTPVC